MNIRTLLDKIMPQWKTINIIVYAALCLLAFSPYMNIFYPGIVEVDTSFQLAMSMGYGYGTITDYASPFPVFDIRLLGALYTLGENIGGDATSGIWTICLFQCVGIATSISLITCYLSKWSVPSWARLIVFVFFAALPIVPLMAVDLGKDTIFCMFFVPFTLCACEYVRKVAFSDTSAEKNDLKGNIFLISATSIFGILSFLSVSKGIVIVVVCLIGAFIIAWRKHRAALLKAAGTSLGICLIAQMLFSFAILPAMSQGLPDSSSFLRESFGTPIQQATWAAKVNGQITDTERDRLNGFYDLDAAVGNYSPDTSDNTKVFVRKDVTISDAIWMLDAYVSIGIAHPKEYLKSFIDLYDGYWQAFTTESLMLPRLMPGHGEDSPLVWDNLFRFPGSIDDAITAVQNDWVLYSHGNLPEYSQQHPEFGDWEMNEESDQARKDVLTFVMEIGKMPVLGLLVSKSLYVLYLPLIILIATVISIKRPNKGAAVLLLFPLGISCIFAFLSPADLARYVYPCLMLCPLYVALVGHLVRQRLMTQRKQH